MILLKFVNSENLDSVGEKEYLSPNFYITQINFQKLAEYCDLLSGLYLL